MEKNEGIENLVAMLCSNKQDRRMAREIILSEIITKEECECIWKGLMKKNIGSHRKEWETVYKKINKQ